jgi:peptidoglycan/xylan/chitin deacetylase (PgdA/CDA1 family)
MNIAKIPSILSRTFKSLTWDLPSADKEVYLTFDDGPTPEVTEWVLNILNEFSAKATFFCLGNNVAEQKEIYEKILKNGHVTGNHSYNHKKGFRTSTRNYLKDIDKASTVIDSRLFRPPYGRIWPWQARKVSKKYQVVMWSVLSVDYNSKISGPQVVKNVIENVKPGSIIVFHDSVKASKNLYFALPEVLSFLKENDYKMRPIPVSD